MFRKGARKFETRKGSVRENNNISSTVAGVGFVRGLSSAIKVNTSARIAKEGRRKRAA